MVALAVLPEGCGGNGKTSCAAEGIAQIKNNMTLIAANDALARFLGRETLRVLRIMIYLHILVSSKTSGQPNPENGSQRTLDLCRTWYCRGDITSAERHTQLLINAVIGQEKSAEIHMSGSATYRALGSIYSRHGAIRSFKNLIRRCGKLQQQQSESKTVRASPRSFPPAHRTLTSKIPRQSRPEHINSLNHLVPVHTFSCRVRNIPENFHFDLNAAGDVGVNQLDPGVR